MARPKKLTTEEAYKRQLARNAEYNRTHKKKAYRNQKKSRAKSFINKDATAEELKELQTLIDERLEEISEN